MGTSSLKERIFQINTEENFNQVALSVFHAQYKQTAVYRQYVDLLKTDIAQIEHYSQIPFLPVQFFKTQDIIDESRSPEIIFTSSGTTGMITSRHLVADQEMYRESFGKAFNLFYGNPENVAVLALLPSYLEREGSSLIYMVDDLIQQSKHHESGYFLYNHQDLYETLKNLHAKKTKTILFGVTYALLDFVEKYTLHFPELIVMETGGMKGKRKEMVRSELHQVLSKGFGVKSIHSEYGMTELLSQAYSSGNGLFSCPPWMKVLMRDTNDPLTIISAKKTGGVNIIDLANLYSCSFIATQDLGKIHPNHQFEILGRFDQSDIRGCNLLVQ